MATAYRETFSYQNHCRLKTIPVSHGIQLTSTILLLLAVSVINPAENQTAEPEFDTSKIDRLLEKLISSEDKTKASALKELADLHRETAYQKQLEDYLLEKRGLHLEKLAAETQKRSKELGKLKKLKAELAKKREEALSALFGYRFNTNITNMVEGLDKSSEATAIHQLMFEVKKFYLAIPEVRLSREADHSVLIIKTIDDVLKTSLQSNSPADKNKVARLKIENEDVAGLLCLNRTVFRDWPLDEKERELFSYNNAVDEFNRGINTGETDERIRDLMQTWNEVREIFGLKKIRINLKLVEAARLHSQDMARTGRFSDEEERFVNQVGYKDEMRGGCVALYKLRDPEPKMPLSLTAGQNAKLFDIWTIPERIHQKKLFFGSGFTEAGAYGEESKSHHGQAWTIIVGIPAEQK